MLPLLFLTVAAGWSDPGDITITVYELKDYVRHPRMEEEDRLKGGDPSYRPGLEIITDVDDTEIRFFEERVGRTPAEWDYLAAGAYRVRLERTGFEIVEFRVQVRSDRRTVVFVEMPPSEGTLRLNGLPPSAAAVYNRTPVAEGGNRVPAGTSSLSVTAFGWEPVTVTLEVQPGEVTEWNWEGEPSPFSVAAPRIRPRVLPTGDRRGFQIDWTATAPGTAELMIRDAQGTLISTQEFGIADRQGTIFWQPKTDAGEYPAEGDYSASLKGIGEDETVISGDTKFIIDNSFIREPRPNSHILPGLMFAPGTTMLPPVVWQASTGAGIDIGTGTSTGYTGVPIDAGLRISPGRRWEITGKFGMKAVDPFDRTSLSLSVAGSWRITPRSGPFEANLALLFRHSGLAVEFGTIPFDNPGMELPGLQLSVPMEYAFSRLSVVLAPSVNMFFPGDDPGSWTLAGPARFTGSVGTGIYWENGRFLVGGSTAVRSPDLSGNYLDWTLWSGLEGRIDLPGEAAYFAGWCGVRYLDIDPVAILGIEFGVIR